MVSICAAVLMFIVGSCCLVKRIRKKYDSEYNKLGGGGFGVVYKGVLPNGQEIDVKRLHRCSVQGAMEFKNEVEVLARVRHKNLVRLAGFCLEAEESILVYEYMPNRSLDYILFDPEKRTRLYWTKRYKIIKGIVQGIQYLYEESNLGRIIHCDFKASHVLLDSEINPKITVFGLAMVFGVDQTERHATAAGILGYVAPEYVVNGSASVKIDVYSFGVLLMEIISGERNSFSHMKGVGNLLGYAWVLWKDGEPLEPFDPIIRECSTLNEVMRCILIALLLWKDGEPLEPLDPIIRECYTLNEVMRCILIALLCVQENPIDRPSMSSIVLMLECYSMTLPTPSQPALFIQGSKEDKGCVWIVVGEVTFF